jgi:hypothetical protein
VECRAPDAHDVGRDGEREQQHRDPGRRGLALRREPAPARGPPQASQRQGDRRQPGRAQQIPEVGEPLRPLHVVLQVEGVGQQVRVVDDAKEQPGTIQQRGQHEEAQREARVPPPAEGEAGGQGQRQLGAHEGRGGNERRQCEAAGTQQVQPDGRRHQLGERRLEAGGEEGSRPVAGRQQGEGEVEGHTLRRQLPIEADQQAGEGRKAREAEQRDRVHPVEMQRAQRDQHQAVQRAAEALDVLSRIEDQTRVQEEQVVHIAEVDEGVVEKPAVVEDQQEPDPEQQPLVGRRPRSARTFPYARPH